MAAYTYQDYANRSEAEAKRIPDVAQINERDILNNLHRPPFQSGPTAARALLVYAERQLTDPVRGPAYHRALRRHFTKFATAATEFGRRAEERRTKANVSVAGSEIEPSVEQLTLISDIALAQAAMAERMIPRIAEQGQTADRVFDALDSLTRDGLRSYAELRAGKADSEMKALDNWTERLENLVGDKAIAHRYSTLLASLEETIPTKVERALPEYEFANIVDQNEYQATIEQLIEADASLDPRDAEDMALSSVYANMSAEQRADMGHFQALTELERVQFSMDLIASAPSMVRMPASEMRVDAFGVVATTVEEANVFEYLIRNFGSKAALPTADEVRAEFDSLKEIPAHSAMNGRFTVGIVVGEALAEVDFARQVIADLDDSVRVIMYTANQDVAAELAQIRAEKANVNTGLITDYNRDLGSYALPDNGMDIVVDATPAGAAALVANSEGVFVYGGSSTTRNSVTDLKAQKGIQTGPAIERSDRVEQIDRIIELAGLQQKLKEQLQYSGTGDAFLGRTGGTDIEGGLKSVDIGRAVTSAGIRRRLDDPVRQAIRRLYQPVAGVNAIAIDGSNWYRGKGTEQVVQGVVTGLPPRATIIAMANDKNPVVQTLLKNVGERKVIYATAYRENTRSRVMSGDDGASSMSTNRGIRLDLGKVRDASGRDRPRKWSAADIGASIVLIKGYAPNGSAKMANFIAEEAVVDLANSAILFNNMGTDYHVANLTRLAVDSDKLAAVIDTNGQHVDVERAYENAIQTSRSIVENTMKSIAGDFEIETASTRGQMVLRNIPDMTSAKALAIALDPQLRTLGDVYQAALDLSQGKTVPAAYPHPVLEHYDGKNGNDPFLIPQQWNQAIARANAAELELAANHYRPLVATSPEYPQSLRDAGITTPVYALGGADLAKPTFALVVGGDKALSAADRKAIEASVTEATAKGWNVSIHMDGRAGTAEAAMLAAGVTLEDGRKSTVLMVGNGDWSLYDKTSTEQAIHAVLAANERNGYIATALPVSIDTGIGPKVSLSVAGNRTLSEAEQAALKSLVETLGTDFNGIDVSSPGGVSANHATLALGEAKYARNGEMVHAVASYEVSKAEFELSAASADGVPEYQAHGGDKTNDRGVGIANNAAILAAEKLSPDAAALLQSMGSGTEFAGDPSAPLAELAKAELIRSKPSHSEMVARAEALFARGEIKELPTWVSEKPSIEPAAGSVETFQVTTFGSAVRDTLAPTDGDETRLRLNVIVTGADHTPAEVIEHVNKTVSEITDGKWAGAVKAVDHVVGINDRLTTDPLTAMRVQAAQAEAVALVRSSAHDTAMITVREAIENGKPVAAFGPSSPTSANLDDRRYRTSAYGANAKLLVGAGETQVQSLGRTPAMVQNSSYSHMDGGTGQRETRGFKSEQDSGSWVSVKSRSSGIPATSGNYHTPVAWSAAAEYIRDGRGTEAFLEAVTQQSVPSIAATEEMRAMLASQREAKILSREHASEGILDHFAEVQERFAGEHDNDKSQGIRVTTRSAEDGKASDMAAGSLEGLVEAQRNIALDRQVAGRRGASR